MISEKTKRYGFKALLGAVAAITLVTGFAAAPSAKAEGWYGDRHEGWDRGRGYEDWRRHEWFEHHRYGYYPQPRVYYAPPPPPVYYAPRPYAAPPAYYPGSFNVTIPFR